MQVDKCKLNDALLVLYEEPPDSYYSGYFVYLIQDIRSKSFWAHAGVSTNINADQLAKRLLIVHMDLLNLATVSLRLILQQNLRGDKSEYRIGDNLWRFFGSVDIDMFFIKYRSIFDNIAQVIKATSTRDSQMPISFNDLITWVKNPKFATIIDHKYIRLIEQCDWFKDIKKIRDSIEHQGAETAVNYDRDKIMFRVSGLGIGLTNLPEINIIKMSGLPEENGFVNFEHYAGIYLGYLIWFLEELSKLIFKKIESFEIDHQSRTWHPGFMIVRSWIECVTKIKSGS